MPCCHHCYVTHQGQLLYPSRVLASWYSKVSTRWAIQKVVDHMSNFHLLSYEYCEFRYTTLFTYCFSPTVSREVWISGCRLCDYIVKNRLTAEFALVRLKNKYPFFLRRRMMNSLLRMWPLPPKMWSQWTSPLKSTPMVWVTEGWTHQALGGGSESAHINLFTLQSDRTSSLFGDRNLGKQCRGGIAGGKAKVQSVMA